MSEKHNLLPYPFCGGQNIRIDLMYCDDDGEHEGAECMDCDATARADHWNNRAGQTTRSDEA